MNKLINGDCNIEVKKLKDNSIDLCIIDPPYNVNYKYGSYKDNLEHKEYMNWQIGLIDEIGNKLKDLEEYSTNETESYEELMKQKETLLSNVTIETRDKAIQILTIINIKINKIKGNNVKNVDQKICQ